MDFSTYLNNSWNDHADKTSAVVQSFPKGFDLLQNADEISGFARIVCHVYGEHLGEWKKGIDFLEKLNELSFSNESSRKLVNVLKASLELSGEFKTDLSAYTISERVRILATSVSALYSKGEIEKSKKYLKEANELAQSGLDKQDPANRSMAIAGNNLAASLEEKISRTAEETELMIVASEMARKYWEIAGTWLEVERAEYRLAKTYLSANQYDQSLKHAKLCLDIIEKNSAPALEFFFAYECLGSIAKSLKQSEEIERSIQNMELHFEKLSKDDQVWCRGEILKLNS